MLSPRIFAALALLVGIMAPLSAEAKLELRASALPPVARAGPRVAGRRDGATCNGDKILADPAALTVTAEALRGGAAASPASAAQAGQTLSYFVLWYALNVVYNIINKQVLNKLPLPWLLSVAQLFAGVVWARLIWLVRLRKKPELTEEGLKQLIPIGIFHGVGQAATVLSLGAGAVSFTHIVKALEPFFSALCSAAIFRVVLRPQVYATLIPVVGGVSLAVAKEMSFTWLSFGTAMASNLAFALRAVCSKVAMGKNLGKNLTAPNLFAVVTGIAFVTMLPFALGAEAGVAVQRWNEAVSQDVSPSKLAMDIALSGLFHYTNNEVMFLALSNVHPITLAVGNTLKRVVIIVASLLVFRNPMTPTAAMGSGIGICGVLLYSLTKQHYDKIDAAAAAAAAAGGAKAIRGKRA